MSTGDAVNISGEYLGMMLNIDSNDHENQGFFPLLCTR